MKGKIEVRIQNNRIQFKFTLNRNLTILKGNSATGKTTLIEMVRLYEENGADSGITLSCPKNCTVIGGTRWQENLKNTWDSIVFIDEGNSFLRSRSFAKAIADSDNYYVIATREPLPNLPYSVEEVYGITNTTRKKYNRISRLYSQFEHIYTPLEPKIKPDHVIVEDTNAGFQFFKILFEEKGIPCISAKGKSNIFKTLIDFPFDNAVLVIADGAAFGPEMEKIIRISSMRNVALFLPESFEWMVLSSGLIDGVATILEDPSEHIESRNYFSWERFFNGLLTEKTKDDYLQYTKKALNPNYLRTREKQAIEKTMPVSLL